MNKTEKYLKNLIQEMPKPAGELSFTMDQVELGESQNELTNIKWGRRRSVRYVLAAICGLFMIVSVPVAAHIPYISERMQILSNKEIQDLTDMTQQQMTEADLFSRPLSREERIRMEAVRQEYENGIFPKGEILIVSGDEQIDIDYYYNQNTGMFYLPDSRELTDEELGQYIDFYYKRDYSLQTHQNQEMAANPALEDKSKNELSEEFVIPHEHREIILDWLRLYDISDLELTDLENKLEVEGIYRPSEDFCNYIYLYPMAEGTLRFHISEDGDMKFLNRLSIVPSEEAASGTTIPKLKPLAETDKFESIKKVLEESRSMDWKASSAWYLCQSDSEGYLRYDAFGYLFTDEEGKGWVFMYENGAAYPTRIMYMTYDWWVDEIRKAEKLEEINGVKFDHNVISLDINTGEVS
ncbi:MAG: hypothetical protein K2O32_03855 [Acetatifactor sp.]|nr:hypothetical protein [Acetatifactor sp.]